MTMLFRASARSTPLASVAGVSASRGGVASISATEIEDPGFAFFVLGAAPAPPTTFGDFTLSQGSPVPLDRAVTTVTEDMETGLYTVAATWQVLPDVYSEGDDLYAAIFLGAGRTAPETDVVPDGVVGPIHVVA